MERLNEMATASPIHVAVTVSAAATALWLVRRTLRRHESETERAGGSEGEVQARDGGTSASTSDRGRTALAALAARYSAFLDAPPNMADTPWALVDATLPVSALQLWDALFGSDAFLARFYDRQAYTNIHLGQWADDRRRTTTYTKALKSNPLGPRRADCIEKYRIVAQTTSGFLVSVLAVTPHVPFGSHFHCSLRFSVTPGAHSGECRLQIAAGVTFTQNTWMRGLIAKEAKAGMRETYAAYERELITFLRGHFPSAAARAPHAVLPAQAAALQPAEATTLQAAQPAQPVGDKVLSMCCLVLLVAVAWLVLRVVGVESRLALLEALVLRD